MNYPEDLGIDFNEEEIKTGGEIFDEEDDQIEREELVVRNDQEGKLEKRH